MKQYRESFKNHLETGCLAVGWKRWIAAGVVMFLLLFAVEWSTGGSISATQENLLDEPFRLIRNFIFKSAQCGKYAVLALCVLKSICSKKEEMS